jgi:hypothetical protein
MTFINRLDQVEKGGGDTHSFYEDFKGLTTSKECSKVAK